MMFGGMALGGLLGIVLLLGFAYVIWVMSSKEEGVVKIAGQIIAVIIAVLVLLFLVGGLFWGGMSGRYGMGGHMMGPYHDYNRGYWKDIMKSPEMQKYMKEYREKEKSTN